MTTTDVLADLAAWAIQGAEFRSAWPVEVRKALVRAAQTEGPFPPYAERETRWALREAKAVEQRLAKQVEAGEAALSHAERRRLAVAR